MHAMTDCLLTVLTVDTVTAPAGQCHQHAPGMQFKGSRSRVTGVSHPYLSVRITHAVSMWQYYVADNVVTILTSLLTKYVTIAHLLATVTEHAICSSHFH
ncbi:hypothetical protein COO60DRAFT_1286616 [Scenedesmus sp. NREL 46B-D3]|nr:hypothetical protein COO60DRAFT_1286616 [Scenedesmus sp. NREL 46B-D3]